MDTFKILKDVYPEPWPSNLGNLAHLLSTMEEHPNLSSEKYVTLTGICSSSFFSYVKLLRSKGLIDKVYYKVTFTKKPDLKLVKETPTETPTTGLVFPDSFWERLQNNPLAQCIITIAQSPPGTSFLNDRIFFGKQGISREDLLNAISNMYLKSSVDTLMDLLAIYLGVVFPGKMAELKSPKTETDLKLEDLISLLKPYQNENGSHFTL